MPCSSHRQLAHGQSSDAWRQVSRLAGRSVVGLAVAAFDISLLFASSAPASDCAQVPDEASIQRLLEKKEYDDLESLASQSRDCKVETSEGLRALEAFYDKVANLEEEAPEARHKKLIQNIEKWKKAKPESPAPRVALAKAYGTYAWKGRGRGVAKGVNEEGWKLYYERSGKALAELGQGVERDPQAYVELMTLAKAGIHPKGMESRDVSFSVFLKGIEIDPDYYPLYYEMTTQLLPQWGGKPGEWEAFAREYADKRGGLAGKVLYSRILLEKSRWFWEWDYLRKINLPWGDLRAILDGIAAERPDSAVERNLYCYFATLALDRETASTLFDWIEQGQPKERGAGARRIPWVWEDSVGSDRYDYFRLAARRKRQAAFEMNMEPLLTAEGTLTFTVTVRGPDGSVKPDLGYERRSGVEDLTYLKFVPQHVRLAGVPDEYPPGRYVMTMVVKNSTTGVEKTWTQEVGQESSAP